MAVDLNDVLPSIVVVIDKAAAPGHIVVVDAHTGCEGEVAETSIAIVVIEVAGIVGKVGLEDVEPAIAIVIGHCNAHAGLLMTIVVVSATGHDGDVSESPIMIVLK